MSKQIVAACHIVVLGYIYIRFERFKYLIGLKVYIHRLAESAHPCTTLDRLWFRGRFRYLVQLDLRVQVSGFRAHCQGVMHLHTKCTCTQNAPAHKVHLHTKCTCTQSALAHKVHLHTRS